MVEFNKKLLYRTTVCFLSDHHPSSHLIDRYPPRFYYIIAQNSNTSGVYFSLLLRRLVFGHSNGHMGGKDRPRIPIKIKDSTLSGLLFTSYAEPQPSLSPPLSFPTQHPNLSTFSQSQFRPSLCSDCTKQKSQWQKGKLLLLLESLAKMDRTWLNFCLRKVIP